jgi:hypothetical protein
MLSRKQFLDKHRVKFQGLSQADKTKRYNDYVSQFGSNQKKEPVRQRQMTRAHEAGMKRSVGMSNIKFSNYSQFRKMKKDMVEQYIRSVLNPWEFKAHMPDPLSYRGFLCLLSTRTYYKAMVVVTLFPLCVQGTVVMWLIQPTPIVPLMLLCPLGMEDSYLLLLILMLSDFSNPLILLRVRF